MCMLANADDVHVTIPIYRIIVGKMHARVSNEIKLYMSIPVNVLYRIDMHGIMFASENKEQTPTFCSL